MMDVRTHTLVRNGRKKILCWMKEIPSQQSKENLASLNTKKPSNVPIKRQFEVASKKEEIINDEFRMQDVIEPIIEQPIRELK